MFKTEHRRHVMGKRRVAGRDLTNRLQSNVTQTKARGVAATLASDDVCGSA